MPNTTGFPLGAWRKASNKSKDVVRTGQPANGQLALKPVAARRLGARPERRSQVDGEGGNQDHRHDDAGDMEQTYEFLLVVCCLLLVGSWVLGVEVGNLEDKLLLLISFVFCRH